MPDVDMSMPRDVIAAARVGAFADLRREHVAEHGDVIALTRPAMPRSRSGPDGVLTNDAILLLSDIDALLDWRDEAGRLIERLYGALERLAPLAGVDMEGLS